MNNIAKLVILTSLVASSLFGGENSITKRHVLQEVNQKAIDPMFEAMCDARLADREGAP